MIGNGPAALEAALFSGDVQVATRALESATIEQLVPLLHNRSVQIRTSASTQLEQRVKGSTDPDLEAILTTLKPTLADVLAIVSGEERGALVRLVRLGLTANRQGGVRRQAIRCLLTLAPDACSEFVSAPVGERLAAVDALAGRATLMEFLDDDDEEVVAKVREGLTALPGDEVIAQALVAMKAGSAAQQLAALAAVEPLLASHWRPLFEPLLSLTTGGRGAPRAAAARALAQLTRARRLSRKHLTLIAEALAAVPDEREAATAVRAMLSGPADASTDPLRAIELQLEADGSDEAWAVYGDALLAAGDVRGELVVTANDARKFKAVLKRHQATLFGALEGLLAKNLARLLKGLTWRHGFVEGAFVYAIGDLSLEEVLDALLGAPVSRFLSKLELGLSDEGGDNDYAAAVERLGDSGGAHLLSSLLLGRFDDEEAQMSWAPWGDVSALWATCPGLTQLHLRGAGGTLGVIDAPRLESLIVETGGLARAPLAAIATAKLPRLRHLEVWFGASGYGCECVVADAERLLARSDPNLRSLALKNAEFTHELIPLLAGWKPLRQLEVLDLSLGVLSDEDVDVLLSKRAAFEHLTRLDLRGNLLLGRARELREALPNAVMDEQREPDTERYVAVGE